MTDCDKFKKKYNIGLVIFILILPVVMFGMGQSGWILFLIVLLILMLGVVGMVLMLPYYTCLTSASNNRKPPFS